MRVAPQASASSPNADDAVALRDPVAGIRPVPHEIIEHYRREAMAMRRAAFADLAHRLGARPDRFVRSRTWSPR